MPIYLSVVKWITEISPSSMSTDTEFRFCVARPDPTNPLSVIKKQFSCKQFHRLTFNLLGTTYVEWNIPKGKRLSVRTRLTTQHPFLEILDMLGTGRIPSHNLDLVIFVEVARNSFYTWGKFYDYAICASHAPLQVEEIPIERSITVYGRRADSKTPEFLFTNRSVSNGTRYSLSLAEFDSFYLQVHGMYYSVSRFLRKRVVCKTQHPAGVTRFSSKSIVVCLISCFWKVLG